MTILILPIKIILCSGVLFSYYYLFLRNKRFHQYNRFYLLSATILSLVFPMIRIPAFNFNGHDGNAFIKTLEVISVSGWEEEFIGTAPGNFVSAVLTINNTLWFLYAAGVCLLGFSFIRSLLYIRSISSKYLPERLDHIILYDTREPGTPFSFFNNIYWNEAILRNSEKGVQILRHEMYHVRAGHSYDTIFLQVLTAVCWFNPLYHLIAREVKAIHEFLADEHASRHTGKHAYADMLVTEALILKKVTLSNQFFHNQIKRRISMIIKNNPSNLTYLRRIMALPLIAGVFCAFAFRSAPTRGSGSQTAAVPVTVIIDAGHGGIDAGVRGANGLTEKDLTLAIAKKINEMSATYGIKVIMTRDQDILPGNALNAIDGLKNRTGIAQQGNADLFVSIHINQKTTAAQPGAQNGFDIYVSQMNKEFNKSRLLGSAISGEIKKSYPMSDALRESNAIWVLKSIEVPAVLIECGYMDDEKDLAFISDEKNQLKLAANILQGIVNYTSNVSSKALVNEDESHLVKLQQTVQEPGYPGGPQAWIKYLNSNFKYPEEAIKKQVDGTVVVQFAIDANGKVSRIEAITGPDAGGLKKEAIRMISESGDWLPARENNQAVASVKKQPITFRLK